MRVSNNSKGIEIEGGATTHDWSVDKLVATANTTGLRVRGESYDMSIIDSNFVNNEFGFTSFTHAGDTPPAPPGSLAVLDGLEVRDSAFTDNAKKAMYFEALSDALLDNLVVRDNGNEAGYNAGAGIDLNLKRTDYSGIVDSNSEIVNSGSGSATFGGGITVKGRDYATSYDGIPGSLDYVQLDGNEIVPNVPVGGNSVRRARQGQRRPDERECEPEQHHRQ